MKKQVLPQRPFFPPHFASSMPHLNAPIIIMVLIMMNAMNSMNNNLNEKDISLYNMNHES